MYNVEFISNIPNWAIVVNGNGIFTITYFVNNGTTTFISLPNGTYTYTASYAGYYTITGEFTISGYNQTVYLNFQSTNNTVLPYQPYSFNKYIVIGYIAFTVLILIAVMYYVRNIAITGLVASGLLIIGFMDNVIPSWSIILIVAILSILIAYKMVYNGGDDKE
jgi:hypothetical protein